MLANIKSTVKKTKKFAKEHQTTVACAATAVVAWKLSHDITLKGVLEETTDLAYEWGQNAGRMEMHLLEAYNFIKNQGLFDEFNNTSLS